jgi:hypothetical protein
MTRSSHTPAFTKTTPADVLTALLSGPSPEIVVRQFGSGFHRGSRR